MFRLRIKQLMKEKAVKAPLKELKKNGISHAIGHKYLRGNGQWIVVEHIAKICLQLHCEPNDLFEWIPDNKLQDDPNQPLQKVKPRSHFDLLEATKQMPPEELREMLEEHEKKKKKDKEDDKKDK